MYNVKRMKISWGPHRWRRHHAWNVVAAPRWESGSVPLPRLPPQDGVGNYREKKAKKSREDASWSKKFSKKLLEEVWFGSCASAIEGWSTCLACVFAKNITASVPSSLWIVPATNSTSWRNRVQTIWSTERGTTEKHSQEFHRNHWDRALPSAEGTYTRSFTWRRKWSLQELCSVVTRNTFRWSTLNVEPRSTCAQLNCFCTAWAEWIQCKLAHTFFSNTGWYYSIRFGTIPNTQIHS